MILSSCLDLHFHGVLSLSCVYVCVRQVESDINRGGCLFVYVCICVCVCVCVYADETILDNVLWISVLG